MRRFVGGRLRRRLGPFVPHMGASIIALLVEGYNPADRAHGEVRVCQQAPQAELPGIGMAFLEVRDLDHDGKPPLAGGLGTSFVVHEPHQVRCRKAPDPPVHGRARPPYTLADTHRLPALIVACAHMEASLGAVRRRVRVPQCALLGGDNGAVLPPLFDGMVMDGGAKRAEQAPGECAGMQAGVEGFEAMLLLAYGRGNPLRSAAGYRCALVGQPAEPALGAAAACAGANRVGVGGRFLRPLGGRALFTPHERADQCRAPLDLSHTMEGHLGHVQDRCHRVSPSPGAQGAP